MADATAAVVTVQAAKLKRGQRLYSNSGAASMGYDLPATIGAWHGMAEGSERIICLAGDGSIMQNLQELQTIVGQKIPAKIFLFNNSGYHSIRQTQQSYFNGFSVGCGPDSGVTFPDFGKIAAAFGLAYTSTTEHEDMERAISETLSAPGAAICEIFIDKAQNFAPKVSSRRLEDGTMVTAPLEDLAPFLPRDELAEALKVPE
jgi:acetolactate synthase-1/2/3 large subunit